MNQDILAALSSLSDWLIQWCELNTPNLQISACKIVKLNGQDLTAQCVITSQSSDVLLSWNSTVATLLDVQNDEGISYALRLKLSAKLARLSALEYYNTHYELIFSHDFASFGKKVTVENQKPNFCRFCMKSYPSTTFKNKAHAIPDFIGNRTLVSFVECDSCNDKAGNALERQLALFLSAMRPFFDVKSGNCPVPDHSASDVELKKYQDLQDELAATMQEWEDVAEKLG